MHFCMKQLRTLKFKIKIKKSKTYSGGCPFPGLSNGTMHSHADPIWPDDTFNAVDVLMHLDLKSI